MIALDWPMMLLGGAAGVVVGSLFFVGLAIGMRRALHSDNPAVLLTLSAVLRIITLLGFGWTVLQQGGAWAGLGFALAFFVTRLIATTWARIGIPAGRAS
jgi:F1F0 ATPase subunit 2